MSWLAPLLNNKIGDRLNLELRHEHLFFIQGDRVLKDIGYSEKGRRFSEIELKKPIRSLEDLKKNGYWLVGPTVMGCCTWVEPLLVAQVKFGLNAASDFVASEVQGGRGPPPNRRASVEVQSPAPLRI
jgi:hypothetical protein